MLFVHLMKTFQIVQFVFMQTKHLTVLPGPTFSQFSVLKRLGFDTMLTSGIKLVYAHPIISILTNLQKSFPFWLCRSTRQGCPLSPILFDLVIKTLAIASLLCQRHNKDVSLTLLSQCDNKDVSGIWRGKIKDKVSLCVDDLVLFISCHCSLRVRFSTNFVKVESHQI